ncbi:MAG: hypothetical protein LOY03_14990 [Cyclobacteriaceae bacterium]|nr:hypothetical protein [Cyclobacteriaceae bacterium]
MSPRPTLSWIPSMMIVSGVMIVTSCKDDEKPNSKISFAQEGMEITESDGTPTSFHPLLLNGGTGRDIEVKLLLDRPLDETAVIAYTIGGSAKKNTASDIGNFEIKGNNEYLTIGPGATEATITITVFENFDFDAENETNPFVTVILTLESVVSGPAELSPGTQNIFPLTIYEDDTFVLLTWDNGTQDQVGDVDMDLWLWLDNPDTPEEDFVNLGGSAAAESDFEGILIPGGFPNGTYGLSYTYWGGTADNVNFYVQLTNFGGNLNGGNTALDFQGAYTLANLNVYDDDQDPNHKGPPAIIQTMVKEGLHYSNISDIVPEDGTSRMNTKVIKSFDGKRGETRLSFKGQ